MKTTLRYPLTIALGAGHGLVEVLPDVLIVSKTPEGFFEKIHVRCWFPTNTVYASWYPNGIIVDLNPSWDKPNWGDVRAKLASNTDIEMAA